MQKETYFRNTVQHNPHETKTVALPRRRRSGQVKRNFMPKVAEEKLIEQSDKKLFQTNANNIVFEPKSEGNGIDENETSGIAAKPYSSLVAAFSKPAPINRDSDEGSNISESNAMHVESCVSNETGKRPHAVSDFTDHVTRFCKPSSDRHSDIAGTDSNLLVKTSISLKKRNNEHRRKTKMKMEDSVDVTAQQRNLPLKSVSAVEIKLDSRETNKKNAALKRGRRINTVNFPGDNKNRIEARKMPVRRPRPRKDSSSSRSSDSDVDLSPAQDRLSANESNNIDVADFTDKVLVNQNTRSPSRVRARNRKKGLSNASDSANMAERLSSDVQQKNESSRLFSNQEGLINETTNSLKCYSVTKNVEISRNQSSFESSEDGPADCQSSNAKVTSKQTRVNSEDRKEIDGAMSNNKLQRSFAEDKLIIKSKETLDTRNDAQVDAVKHNIDSDYSNALQESTNQNQLLQSTKSTKQAEKKLQDREYVTKGADENSANLNSVPNKAPFDQVKRKQKHAGHAYENVTFQNDGKSHVKQGNLLIAKKVSVACWPEDAATREMLNVNAVSKATAISDKFTIAKENSMIQEAAEREFLQHLAKETNLSDPIYQLPSEGAPLPPRRNKQSRSFHQNSTSELSHSAVVSRSHTDGYQKVSSAVKRESPSLRVENDRNRFRSRNLSRDKDIAVPKENGEEHNKSSISIQSEYTEGPPDAFNHLTSNNESQLFVTSSVSTRKSSIVSQSTALPTRRSSSKREDSEDSGEVDEGFTEEIQEKGENLRLNSGVFPTGRRRRTSHQNEDSKPHSPETNRSLSDPLANFSALTVRPDHETDKFPLRQKPRSRGSRNKNNSDRNSDSDLSGCSDSSSLEDELSNRSSVHQMFDSSSSFKVPPQKKSFSDPNTNVVYAASVLRQKSSEQGDTPTFNSYANRLSGGSSDFYDNDAHGHSLRPQTKTFRAKERKYAAPEDFKNSEENLFLPIKQIDVSSESLSPTDNSSIEDSLETKEKEFQDMLQEMNDSQKTVSHAKSYSAPAEDLQTDLPRIPDRARRTGRVGKTYRNGDITYGKPYPGFNDYPQEKKKTDMRKCVVTNLLETEDFYVASLRQLMENYLKPLKQPVNQNVAEPQLVDDVIFQVSHLLHNHQQFTGSVRERYEAWNPESKIGELFIEAFNKDMLLKSYTNYINNFNSTKEVINVAIDSNAAFRISLEQSQRESKQNLADLMIKPVQRVPRYELLIKDLLKHTHSGHPDYEDLLIAQKEIHALAVQMNKGEKDAEAADKHTRLLQEIDQLIEASVEAICIPKRKFIQQEFCTEQKSSLKKDRSLWLFNDMLMGTTVKKGRGSSLRRSTMNLYSFLPDDATVDTANKYKYIWKYPLCDIEIIGGTDQQVQGIREDLKILADIEVAASKISIGHDSLSKLVKDMKESLDKQMQEKQRSLPISTLPNSYTPLSVATGARLEIRALTSFGMKSHQFEFFTEETRHNFERLLTKAKDKYMQQKSQWGPSLLKVIPISKTRNGMQFSCAASNVNTHPGTKEVWVCNTDGHVGQICFLTIESDPQQTQCLTVCNAKICCIAQIPSHTHQKLVPTHSFISAISKANLDVPTETKRPSSVNDPAKTIMAFDESDESDDNNMSPYSTLGSVNSVSSYDLRAGNEIQPNDHSSSNKPVQNNFMHQLMGSGAYKKDSNGSTLHGSLEDLLSDGSSSGASAKRETSGYMWVGTEDGTINVFSTLEPIRTSRHGTQLAHNAAVLCILPHKNQVFVALSNGDLVVYQRDVVSGQWDYNNKKCISGNSSSTPITKMVVVNENEVWCGCQNEVRILNIKTHDLKNFFPVVNDKARQIYCMVAAGYGVWIALDKNPTVKLFHSVTHDLITEVDVTSSVNSMLAGSDAIIRQHKLACLRVTSLLVCKKSLWAGTSAGVVVTVPLPNVTPQTTPLQLDADPQSLGCGHTGHVRFLTEIEVVETTGLPVKGGKKPIGKQRRVSGSASQTKTTTLVVSGGDGFEDFGGYSTNNKAGKEDSTNHLLIWKNNQIMEFGYETAQNLKNLSNLLNPNCDDSSDDGDMPDTGPAFTPASIGTSKNNKKATKTPYALAFDTDFEKSSSRTREIQFFGNISSPFFIRKEKTTANDKDIWGDEEVQEYSVFANQSDSRPQPEYDISYKQKVTSEDMFLGMSGKNPSTACCEDMVVKIKLPGCKMKDVELDVKETFLDCRCPSHRLLLSLPHPVDSKSGNAKWNGKDEVLEVTLTMNREFDFINFQ